jgi:hypothetical protein
VCPPLLKVLFSFIEFGMNFMTLEAHKIPLLLVANFPQTAVTC